MPCRPPPNPKGCLLHSLPLRPAAPSRSTLLLSAPPPPRRGFWGRLFLTFFVLVIGGSFFLNLILLGLSANLLVDGSPRVQEKFVSHDQNAKDKVVILPIEGDHPGERGRLRQAGDRHGHERRARQGRGPPRGKPRRKRQRQRLPLPSPPRTGRERRRSPSSSAWGASPPAAAIMSRWPSATSPTPSSPSRPVLPGRSA